MPVEHHPLTTEFPEFIDTIRLLRAGHQEFRQLSDEYHELDDQIYRIDEDIEPVYDLYAEQLKKRRVFLKDKLYRMLREATAH